MSKRDPGLFLFDTFIAITKIEHTVSNFNTPDDLKHDYLSWDSVMREYTIIGEATKHLISNDLLDKDKQRIVDFRNLIVHHYFGIDEDAVWDTTKEDLPLFQSIIIEHIKNMDQTLYQELYGDFLLENKHLAFVIQALEGLKISTFAHRFQ